MFAHLACYADNPGLSHVKDDFIADLAELRTEIRKLVDPFELIQAALKASAVKATEIRLSRPVYEAVLRSYRCHGQYPRDGMQHLFGLPVSVVGDRDPLTII